MNNNLKLHLDKINGLIQSPSATSNLLEIDLILDYTRKFYEELYVARLTVEQQFIHSRQQDIETNLQGLAPILEMPVLEDEPQDIAIDLPNIEKNIIEEVGVLTSMNTFPVDTVGANESAVEIASIPEISKEATSVLDFSNLIHSEKIKNEDNLVFERLNEVDKEEMNESVSEVLVDNTAIILNTEPLPMISPAPILEEDQPTAVFPQTVEIEKSTIGAIDIQPDLYQSNVFNYDAMVASEDKNLTTLQNNDEVILQDLNVDMETADINNEPILEEKYDYINTFLNPKELLTDDFIEKLLNSNAVKETVISVRPNISKYIGINDRYQFMNELFNNDKQLFDDTLNKIAAKSNFTAAEQYIISELIPQNKWNYEDPTYLNLLSVVKRYFSENI